MPGRTVTQRPKFHIVAGVLWWGRLHDFCLWAYIRQLRPYQLGLAQETWPPITSELFADLGWIYRGTAGKWGIAMTKSELVRRIGELRSLSPAQGCRACCQSHFYIDRDCTYPERSRRDPTLWHFLGQTPQRTPRQEPTHRQHGGSTAQGYPLLQDQ